MRSFSMCVLAGCLLLAWPLAAQVVSTPTPVVQETLTTGMVGFTAAQTAQLNVLNMSEATTLTVAGCEVQLAFYDAQGHLLKQGAAVNITPGTATSLSLGRSDVTSPSVTTLRLSVRGQVSTVAAPTASASPAVILSSCTLFTSLEVYETATGITQVFTTDTRLLSTGGVVPLVVAGRLAGR
jgi:hypothetical protein